MSLATLTAVDTETVWARLRHEAGETAAEEPILASLMHAAILNHDTLSAALSYVLGQKLGGDEFNVLQAREVVAQAHEDDPGIMASAEADMDAVYQRDAACTTMVQPFMYFKGFHALQAHRVAHQLWRSGRQTLAYQVQSLVSERFGVDIHPAARLGKGIMMDHASSIVIGETAVVGDGCSLLHEVTLGGTGVKGGDRHPKIGRGVLIGAGAKVLGNITVGDEAKIAAGSVVLKPVPRRCTVAGVPAKPVGGDCCPEPAKSMDQMLDEEG